LKHVGIQRPRIAACVRLAAEVRRGLKRYRVIIHAKRVAVRLAAEVRRGLKLSLRSGSKGAKLFASLLK